MTVGDLWAFFQSTTCRSHTSKGWHRSFAFRTYVYLTICNIASAYVCNNRYSRISRPSHCANTCSNAFVASIDGFKNNIQIVSCFGSANN
ncbi:hypothetical protein BCR33DRAFT_712387, partial [Rhizoclosmatium globosum]